MKPLAQQSTLIKSLVTFGCAAGILAVGLTLTERLRVSSLTPRELIEEADAIVLDPTGPRSLNAGRRSARAIRLYLLAAEKASVEPSGSPIREYAFVALASRVDHPTLIDSLVATLESPLTAMRRDAAIALGQLADTTASEGLILALRDADSGVRVAAAGALRSIHARSPNFLINSYGDDPELVFEHAPLALTMIDDPAVAQATLRALGSPHAGVRRTALVVIDVAVEDLDSYFGLALGQVRDQVRRSLRDTDPGTRQIASRVLSRFEDTGSLDDRLAALDREDSSSVRNELGRSLEEEHSPRSIRKLVAASDSDRLQTRLAAAESLARLSDPGIVPALVEHLVQRLGRDLEFNQIQRRGSSVVRRVARLDKDVQAIIRAIEASGEPGRAQAREILTQRLREPVLGGKDNVDERRGAALALQTLGDAATAHALIDALTDFDIVVRTYATAALGSLEVVAALPVLVPLYSDSQGGSPQERRLADAVHCALVDISGADQGRDPAAWADWWDRNRRFFLAPGS